MKTVSPELRAAILARACHMCDVAEIDHPSGMVRLSSGVLDVTWNGNVFRAAGKMAGVSGIGQTMEARSQEVVFQLAAPSLDGDSAAIIAQPVQGRSAQVWRLFLTPENSVIGAIQMAHVTLNSLELQTSDGVQVLRLTGYMTQYAARRSVTVRHSNEAQQARFPGDTGFDRMHLLEDAIE